MSQPNEDLVREAYAAYGRGDVDRMLTFVDPELEWTYLDPSMENPEPGPATAGRNWPGHCGGRPGRDWRRGFRRLPVTVTMCWSLSIRPRAGARLRWEWQARRERRTGSSPIWLSRCTRVRSRPCGPAGTGMRHEAPRAWPDRRARLGGVTGPIIGPVTPSKAGPLSPLPLPRVPPRVQLRLGRSRTLVPRRCSPSPRRCGLCPRWAPPRREYLRRHRG